MNVQPLFNLMVEKRASDLFLTCFAPVKIKIDGKIIPVNKLELTPQMVRQAAMELMTGEQLEEFNRELEIDFAVSKPGLGRFRVNIFHQRGNVALVMRYITCDLPDLDTLGMPAILKDLVMFRRGLLLMVGATGSGKSTTLAGMINYRNEKTASHIITIEDPIEFLHANKKSIVNQREVGADTKSYGRALQSAMREAPDVVLVGEVRDRDTMETTIELAGTGRLAISTLHSNNAHQTLDRIINLFPEELHPPFFMDLSNTCAPSSRSASSEVRTASGVAAVEILVNTPHIADLIREATVDEVNEALQQSTERGCRPLISPCSISTRTAGSRWKRPWPTPTPRSNLEAQIHFA